MRGARKPGFAVGDVGSPLPERILTLPDRRRPGPLTVARSRRSTRQSSSRPRPTPPGRLRSALPRVRRRPDRTGSRLPRTPNAFQTNDEGPLESRARRLDGTTPGWHAFDVTPASSARRARPNANSTFASFERAYTSRPVGPSGPVRASRSKVARRCRSEETVTTRPSAASRRGKRRWVSRKCAQWFTAMVSSTLARDPSERSPTASVRRRSSCQVPALLTSASSRSWSSATAAVRFRTWSKSAKSAG